MKREMDLIRAILQKIEEDEGDSENTLTIEGYSNRQVNYHLYLLMDEKFIEGTQTGGPLNFEDMWFYITNLTWKGHEFLDASRSVKIWNSAKVKIREIGGSFTTDLLITLLKSIATTQLGI